MLARQGNYYEKGFNFRSVKGLLRMAIISWSQDYSVGVVELDTHHKQLIKMINELHFAMSKDRGQQLVAEIVNGIGDYAKMHFQVEETYMHEGEYLGILKHIREHKGFVEKAQEMANRCDEGEFILSFEVIEFLSDWLKNHILKSDMKYVPALKSKGGR